MPKHLFPAKEEEWLFNRLQEYFSLPPRQVKKHWCMQVAREFFVIFKYPKDNDPVKLEQYETEVCMWLIIIDKRHQTHIYR